LPTINDYKKATLKTLTGTNGDINTLESKWLKSVVAPYVGAIPDMWRKYLTNLGYTDYSIDQKAMRYLGDLGYTGSITNRWYQYWKNGGPVPLARSLFRSGEDGFLFGNFAELDELFTTTTGQTNVAVNDDLVGLVLDDHGWGSQTLAQIVVAQSELVTNGSFSADANWSKGTGWTISGGAAVKAAGTGSVLGQALAGVDGAAYYWTMTVTRAAGSVNIGWVGTGTVFGYSITASGTYSGVMIAPAGGGLTTLRVTADASFDGTVDNVSVRRIPGNHASQLTSANRPLWKENAGKPYLLLDGSNDALIGSFFPMATGTGLTMAIAFNSTQGAVQTIPMGGGSATARAFIAIIANGRLGIGWGSQVNQAGGSDLRNANHVVVVTGEGESRDVWLDGVNITADFAAAVGTPVSTGGPITLGGRQATVGGAIDQNMPGNISAAVALNRRVTPAEIGQITSSFRSTF
jgi:hypothetical protein